MCFSFRYIVKMCNVHSKIMRFWPNGHNSSNNKCTGHIHLLGLRLDKIIRYVKRILVYFDIWLQNKCASKTILLIIYLSVWSGKRFVILFFFLKWIEIFVSTPFYAIAFMLFPAIIILLSSVLFE